MKALAKPLIAASDWSQETVAALWSALRDELPAARDLRRVIHRNPDLSGAEAPTAQRVINALGLADVADVKGGRIFRIGDATVPAVALRAELDALPIQEATGRDWASVNGAMHACGHDVHLAALVAVVRSISTVGPLLPVLALLQPREESVPSGAPDILEALSSRGELVAAVVGAHVQPEIPEGTFAASAGAVNAAVDDFEIVIRTEGGHAGYPHRTGDPIVAASSIVTVLQGIVARSIDPTHPSVVTVGSLHAGTASNVIPAEAHLSGTIRTFDESDRKLLSAKVGEVSAAMAAIHGCVASTSLSQGEPVLFNDPTLAREVTKWMLAATSMEADQGLRSCGADDFAFYGDAYPSLMIFVGVGEPGGPGLHHEAFCPGDEAVDRVAEALMCAYLASCKLILMDSTHGPNQIVCGSGR